MYNYFKNLEPMKYYDKSTGLSASLKKKRQEMLDNKDNKFVASKKNDGEWTMFIKAEGKILIRSRSVSKVTGEYGDKTLHLPHLTEEMKNWPDGTVVLAEACFDEPGVVSTDVGTILRCLPAKAVARQENKKLVAKMFDVLAYGGANLVNKPYIERIAYITSLAGNYFTSTAFYADNFEDEALAVITKGWEGIVIQRKDNVYEPGKKTAWKTLKVKQKTDEIELKVVKSIPANKEYAGKAPEDWGYWENGVPVSKPYANGWHMGVSVDFNGSIVDVSSGLNDADRAWLPTAAAQEKIKNGELYAVVVAMQVTDDGSLRHPRLIRLRDDI